jgi:cytochrome P450
MPGRAGGLVSTAANAVPEGNWCGLDITDPGVQKAFRSDPHPYLAHLRAVEPVNRTPLGIWRLSRYADCVRLLRDVPCGVRKTDGTLLFDDPSQVRPREFMLSQDPPNHTRLRKLVSKAFTPRAAERLRPRIEAITNECLDAVADAGELDVIADLALPVPASMICEMLGVPLEDRDRFTTWTAQATHLLAAATAPAAVVEEGRRASDALAQYFDGLIAERRARPREDLLSELIRAEEEGDRLSPTELLSQSIGLLIAGFETTIGLIGNGVHALLRHPDQLARLQQEPGLIGPAVEECLRFDGPIPMTVRILHEDAEFGDAVIPRDTMVWALLASANRDPEQFHEPDRFDITRDPNPHLAFGGGAHLCLGIHLARLEAQVAIGTFVQRFRELRLLRDEVEWGPSLFRVLGSLPVGFEPS